MKTYEILEYGQMVEPAVRARTAEAAIRKTRRRSRICASDYNCRRGEIVEFEWTARVVDGENEPTVTMTIRARAE